MDDLFNEFGYDLPDGKRNIMSEEVGAEELGFNLGPFSDDEDAEMPGIPTGQLIRELLMRHPEAMIMLVPPKCRRYSFFVTDELDNQRMVPMAEEAIMRWANHLGMDEE